MIRTTRRLSSRDRRCECGAWIRSGEIYLEHVMSPWHGDVGSDQWERVAECVLCADRYGRGHLLSRAAS